MPKAVDRERGRERQKDREKERGRRGILKEPRQMSTSPLLAPSAFICSALVV